MAPEQQWELIINASENGKKWALNVLIASTA
jgi:hypothetical protein